MVVDVLVEVAGVLVLVVELVDVELLPLEVSLVLPAESKGFVLSVVSSCLSNEDLSQSTCHQKPVTLFLMVVIPDEPYSPVLDIKSQFPYLPSFHTSGEFNTLASP